MNPTPRCRELTLLLVYMNSRQACHLHRNLSSNLVVQYAFLVGYQTREEDKDLKSGPHLCSCMPVTARM
jgi:hypothetical protein